MRGATRNVEYGVGMNEEGTEDGAKMKCVTGVRICSYCAIIVIIIVDAPRSKR